MSMGTVVLLTVALSACGDPNITVTDQPGQVASVAPQPASDSWDNIATFVAAQWNGDDKTALSLVAPNSPAEQYAKYQQALDEAYRTNGESNEQPSLSFADDARAGTVTITEDLPEGADADPEAHVWRDFEVDSQGRIVAWTGTSGPLREALWSKDYNGHIGGARAELVGAYKTNSGSLFVLLDIKAGKQTVHLDSDATYVVDGRAEKPAYWLGPYEVDAGTSAYHLFVFKGSDFGGRFKTQVTSDDWESLGQVSLILE